MTLDQLEREMTKPARLPPTRHSTMRDLAGHEFREFEQALETSVVVSNGDLIVPDEITIEWEDGICGGTRIDMTFGRIQATFDLRLIKADRNTATYEVKEVFK